LEGKERGSPIGRLNARPGWGDSPADNAGAHPHKNQKYACGADKATNWDILKKKKKANSLEGENTINTLIFKELERGGRSGKEGNADPQKICAEF